MATDEPQSKAAIATARAANLGITASNFVAAWFTSNSAMLSEGIHLLVDTVNEQRPFGYGRELYF